jgi:hypothetical protein
LCCEWASSVEKAAAQSSSTESGSSTAILAHQLHCVMTNLHKQLLARRCMPCAAGGHSQHPAVKGDDDDCCVQACAACLLCRTRGCEVNGFYAPDETNIVVSLSQRLRCPSLAGISCATVGLSNSNFHKNCLC